MVAIFGESGEMLKLLLSLSSLLEVFIAVFYFLAEIITEPWTRWCYLACLVVEPAGLYVFAGYVAMRNVTTPAEMVNMILVLPIYYVCLLLLSVFKLDLHQSVFLSNMIYFEFPETSLLWQLSLHLLLMSLPVFALTCFHLFTVATDYWGLLMLLGVTAAMACYLLSILRIISHRRALFSLQDQFLPASVSESESDPTYLDYPLQLSLGVQGPNRL